MFVGGGGGGGWRLLRHAGIVGRRKEPTPFQVAPEEINSRSDSRRVRTKVRSQIVQLPALAGG